MCAWYNFYQRIFISFVRTKETKQRKNAGLRCEAKILLHFLNKTNSLRSNSVLFLTEMKQYFFTLLHWCRKYSREARFASLHATFGRVSLRIEVVCLFVVFYCACFALLWGDMLLCCFLRDRYSVFFKYSCLWWSELFKEVVSKLSQFPRLSGGRGCVNFLTV